MRDDRWDSRLTAKVMIVPSTIAMVGGFFSLVSAPLLGNLFGMLVMCAGIAGLVSCTGYLWQTRRLRWWKD